MATKADTRFPNFRLIRDALLAAPPLPAGFPLHALHDTEVRQQLRITPHLQAFLTEMRQEAARAQATPVEPLSFSLFRLFETTGDRATFERVYFDRRRRLAALALTTILDDTDTYLTALYDLIWEICNEYTWALPAHLPTDIAKIRTNRISPAEEVDLFAAHTAQTLAEIISLLGERLPEWLHYRVRAEIERRIFQPIFYNPQHFWWESAPMNWASVCGGCVGMAALILVADRERLAGMIDRVVRTMECFLDGFGADGGCPEGISYWVYGFGFFTYFAAMLADFTGEQLNLLQNERVKQIAAFPQVVSLGAGRFINFSDAPEQVMIHPGLGSYLAKQVHQPISALKPPNFHADHIARWGHITRDLLWTDAALLEQAVPAGAFYLDDLAWMIDRRIWNDFTVAFAAKGGHNDEPHNHNDLGHFILHLGGESLLVDLGAGQYTRQYFREQRYEFLHTGSQGHSVPTINGRTQRAGINQHAIPLHHTIHANGVSLEFDLTHAYDEPHLEMFRRAFDWSVDTLQHTAVLSLTDTFQFGASGGEIEECFISLVPPVLAENKVIWRGKHGKIAMQFDADVFSIEVQSLEAPMHLGESVSIYRVLLHANIVQVHTSTFMFHCELYEP